MGFFDFLKVSTGEKAKPAARKAAVSVIEVDSRSYPLSTITPKGFIATGFDGSLITGQNARVTVKVDDAHGRFTFAATIVVSEVKDGKCLGSWMMIAPEVEAVIRKYNQNRKAAGGK